MKKPLVMALALLVLVMSVAFTGCGNEPATTDEGTNNLEVYEAFLAGTQEATVERINTAFPVGASYTISGFADAYTEILSQLEYPNTLAETQYAYIDCGADGVPELAISFRFTQDDQPDYTQYVLFKDYDGQLKYIGETFTYYRAEGTVNEYGMVTFGGSNSATSYIQDYSFFDSNGQERFICTNEVVTALSAAGIPQSLIKDGIVNPDIPDYEFCMDEENCFEVEAVNFCRLVSEDQFKNVLNANGAENTEDSYLFCDDLGNYYTADNGTYYDNYFYTICDQDGNDAQPSDEDAALYDSLGLQIFCYDDAMNKVQERKNALGLTTEIEEGGNPEWTTIELPMGE